MSVDWQKEHQRVITAMRSQLDSMGADKIDFEMTKRKAVDRELNRVRSAVQQSARSVLGSSRHSAEKGVRINKYKSVFGGNVNILTTKKGGVLIDTSIYNRPHRRFTSERTKLMESYWGQSRSFILRWMETGTSSRTAGTRYSARGGSGNRGAVTARSFFPSAAGSAMQRAADNLIEQYKIILEKQFNGK